MCVLFAATYPDRASALIMVGSFARRTAAPDHPWGLTEEQQLAFIDRMERLLAPGLPKGADLRCRITHGGVVIEAAPGLDDAPARALCLEEGRVFLGLRPYRRGSAFLHAAQ